MACLFGLGGRQAPAQALDDASCVACLAADTKTGNALAVMNDDDGEERDATTIVQAEPGRTVDGGAGGAARVSRFTPA